MPLHPTAIPPNPPSKARTRLSVRSSRISGTPGADRQAHGDLARSRAGFGEEDWRRRTPPGMASARIVKITPNFQLTSLS
jgi:hypothetical protein